MSRKLKLQNQKRHERHAFACLLLSISLCALHSTGATTTNLPPVKPVRPPETPREFFNAGTRMLQDKKLGEAETYLITCLAQQEAALQPAALYNLGHTRFAQGAELLKKSPDGRKSAARAQSAAWAGAEALREADGAMASSEVERMVQSYLQGRGVRKELNSAIKAIREALEAYGEVLNKWQRASSDFKSAAELNPSDKRAQENAKLVERHIAKLIDEIRMMQQAMMAAAQMQEQLGEKLKELRGKIPDDAMPPGAPGEGEEEEDMPKGLEPGMQEGPSKTGEERPMSPEEAGQILNGFRLDGDRRLPMGEGKEAKPNDPNRKPW